MTDRETIDKAKALFTGATQGDMLAREVIAVAERLIPTPMCKRCGNLESDADSVLMLYRDEVYNTEAEKGLAELIMRKGRNSGVGTVMARWDAATMRFSDIEGTK